VPEEISKTVVSAYERALILGDLAGLKQDERLAYYKAVCESVGLNPLTKPFDYITLNGKLTLYATRACADQLRKLHGVSVLDLHKEFHPDGILMITCKVSDKTGRTDVATGALVVQNLKGNDLANAMMKAETKAKRRATLSLCGLGLLDETEIETLPADVVPAFVPQAITAPAVNQAPCSLVSEAAPVPVAEDFFAAPAPQPTPAPIVPATNTVSVKPSQGLFTETNRPDPAHETRAFPAPPPVDPALEKLLADAKKKQEQELAQNAAHAAAASAPTVPEVKQALATVAAVGDVPCDSKRYSVFVNERATKIIRDKLPKAGVKDAAVLVKNYLLKGAGKTSLPKISAVDFERLLSALEAGTPEEAAAIVTAK
jgi:hypothetical protein